MSNASNIQNMLNFNTLQLLGKRLKNIRKFLNLSRVYIEEIHNIPASSIKIWEAGKAEIGILKLLNYLSVFKHYNFSVDIEVILDKKEIFLDELACSTKMPLTNTAELLANIEHPKYTNDIEKIAYNISRDIKNVLSEQELIFGSLINNLPYKIFLKDDKNNLLKVNQYVADGLGVVPDELKGVSCYKLFPSMADKYYQDDLQTLQDNQPIKNIIENYTPTNSSPMLLITTKVPIINNNKKLILVISRRAEATNSLQVLNLVG